MLPTGWTGEERNRIDYLRDSDQVTQDTFLDVLTTPAVQCCGLVLYFIDLQFPRYERQLILLKVKLSSAHMRQSISSATLTIFPICHSNYFRNLHRYSGDTLSCNVVLQSRLNTASHIINSSMYNIIFKEAETCSKRSKILWVAHIRVDMIAWVKSLPPKHMILGSVPPYSILMKCRLLESYSPGPITTLWVDFVVVNQKKLIYLSIYQLICMCACIRAGISFDTITIW